MLQLITRFIVSFTKGNKPVVKRGEIRADGE